jgi:C4-dicarboxylate-specific signal transduction histidine kinase
MVSAPLRPVHEAADEGCKLPMQLRRLLTPRQWPLAVKLAVAVLALALVPLVVVVLVDARRVETQATERATEGLRKQATDAALRIGERVERLRAYAEVLAANPMLRRAVTSAGGVADPQSAETWVDTHEDVFPTIVSLRRANPWFEHVYLLNARGYCIATSEPIEKPDMLGRDYSYRPYFQAPMQSGRAFVSDVLKNANSEGTAIFVSAPVIVDGSTRAVAVVKVSTDALHEVVGELSRLERRALFIDRFGVVVSEASDGEVSSPDAEESVHFHPLAPVSDKTRSQFRETLRYGDPNGENYLDRIDAPLGLAELWAGLRTGEAGATEDRLPTAVGASPVLTAVGYAPVDSGENEPYGYLIVGEPSAIFREPLQKIGRAALYRFLAVLAAALVLMAFAIRRIAGASEADALAARVEAERATTAALLERGSKKALFERLDQLDAARDGDLFKLVALLVGGDVPFALERSTFEVADVLADVATAARAAASLTKSKIEIDARDAGELHTDRPRLALALRQLVANAIDNTHGGVIELRARRRKGDVLIEVRDSGMGMSPRQIERHFEGPIELTVAEDGRVALGLPIARKIVALLGGTLTAVSTPGEGTTVTLRFTS